MNRLAAATEWAEMMDANLMVLGTQENKMDYAEAFLGVTDDDPPRAVYSEEKVLDVLVKRDGMTYEEAIEFCKRVSRPLKLRQFNSMSYLNFLHHDCCDYCAENDY